ncbi:signal peptide peptidase SppA [Pseudodesulfovibrio sp. JC047]|uniref:signal peptide peptidase SppA n=1 Tax=Pseudodesulfovibrio sp. JC047 TaxID=2683199 RepID=UPI0013D53CDD|nr:signal peptide peptidase SppA [Pseudodesulfovibrio sp. JC047]NDV19700.1 signal peptide peptidase SppA [Pseudodesulfovibrio sp. JC047]
MPIRCILALMLVILTIPACAPKLKIFASPATEPLKEFVVEGKGEGKIALIHLQGFISSQPRQEMLRAKPSPVQELVSALKLAEADAAVKGVVLTIDSPGGTTTGSDVIYHELMQFKERTGKRIVVAMMDVAASGGYYAALPADWILAHPTTITGSVGVVFIRPKLVGLMDKIGVDVEVSKSGNDKDMGSPFRPTTAEEKALFQAIIDDFAARFHTLVATHRSLSASAMNTVKTARVFTATQAQDIGLIDQVGYIQDAFAKARDLSGLPEDSRIVSYRRSVYPNDNPYNTLDSTTSAPMNLLGVDARFIMPPKAGFYYVWSQGLTH